MLIDLKKVSRTGTSRDTRLHPAPSQRSYRALPSSDSSSQYRTEQHSTLPFLARAVWWSTLRRAMLAPNIKTKTLIITHDHCALHQTRKTMAERPHRLQWVMSAIKQLERDIQRDLRLSPLDIKEVKTSEPMLAALESQLISFAGGGGGTPGGSSLPTLLRTASVGYLEEKIVPAVKAVHTRSYIGKLASACVSLTEQAADSPKQPKQPGFTELDGDTVVSASSLSAALCAVLSCCYAVDACCDAALPYLNAFAVIRPPGHHAGVNGPTVEGGAFAAATKQRALDAKPAVLTRAFSFVAQPTPCDGMDCSQGFCLLNNAAIAARHALLSFPARLRKVAIIDIDLHHGNGTEEIVRDRLARSCEIASQRTLGFATLISSLIRYLIASVIRCAVGPTSCTSRSTGSPTQTTLAHTSTQPPRRRCNRRSCWSTSRSHRAPRPRRTSRRLTNISRRTCAAFGRI